MKNRTHIFATILLTLGLSALCPTPKTFGVVPAPDGGYPGGNTAEGQNALLSLTSGIYNTGVGIYSLLSITDGDFNTGVGAGTLLVNTADQNTATGAGALLSNSTGAANTANGTFALFSNTTGFFNTASGVGALQDNDTGGGNIAIGVGAGTSITGGDSNIYIGNVGLAGDSNTTRIGIAKTTQRTFIDGIRGVTTGINDAVNVVIDSAGQLGTISSSRRFKHDIKPMDSASDSILALKPVTFHYKSQNDAKPQFGLIAEEVAEVNPDLVVRDENGEVYTVRYDAVNAMLLNEFLKEHKRVEDQQATMAELKSGMKALAATVKEQAAQIQKVSARVEMNRPGPRVASRSN